jgi:HSP20 family protein
MSTQYLNPVDTVFDRMLGLSRAVDQALATGGPTRRSCGSRRWTPTRPSTPTSIEADLPGVHAENVDVSFERGTLTVSGTRAATLPSSGEPRPRVHAAERPSGSFARAVRLPEYVDGERIEASLADGVLTVRIPKSTGALPRKISVRGTSAEPRQIEG